MKTFRIIGLLLIAAPLVMAAESIVNLDRCVVLNIADDASAASRIAMRFALPTEVQGKEIVYSSLRFTLPDLELNREVLMEIAVFPILQEWSEDEIDYDGVIDSLSIGSFTIKLGANSQFDVDITPYVRQIVQDGRSNFGLMGTAQPLGDLNVQIPENADVYIANSAEVKLVYK